MGFTWFYICNHVCTHNYVLYIVPNCDANPSLGSHISRLRGTSAQNGHVEYEPAKTWTLIVLMVPCLNWNMKETICGRAFVGSNMNLIYN